MLFLKKKYRNLSIKSNLQVKLNSDDFMVIVF